MRLTLCEVILAVLAWLAVIAAVGLGVSALAESCQPKTPEHRYKYQVFAGSATFAAVYGTDHYKIGADGTLTWTTKDGRIRIESPGAWRVEEQAP